MDAKKLIILTGPPGSGKTTYANRLRPHRPIFDNDLSNKDQWRACPTDAILITSAPGVANKAYWLKEAGKAGFVPDLLVMWCDRMVAYERMRARDGASPTQRNDLQKSVERWYKHYGRHRQETRVLDGERVRDPAAGPA